MWNAQCSSSLLLFTYNCWAQNEAVRRRQAAAHVLVLTTSTSSSWWWSWSGWIDDSQTVVRHGMPAGHVHCQAHSSRPSRTARDASNKASVVIILPVGECALGRRFNRIKSDRLLNVADSDLRTHARTHTCNQPTHLSVHLATTFSRWRTINEFKWMTLIVDTLTVYSFYCSDCRPASNSLICLHSACLSDVIILHSHTSHRFLRSTACLHAVGIIM